MRKTKSLSLLLSLALCFSLLTALPACAQNQLNNKIPKTMKIGSITFNGSYNSQSKTLTYQAKNVDNSKSYTGVQNLAEYLNQGLIASSTDTQLNRDYAVLSNYPDPTGVIVNDMIRSGKIKKIKISVKFKGSNFEGGIEYIFTTKNGRVTKMNWSLSEGDSYTYRFSYDSNGNIAKIDQGYLGTSESFQTTTVNYANGKIDSLVDSYDRSNETVKAQYDEKGQILPGRVPAAWSKTYNSDGTLKSCQQTIDPDDPSEARKDPTATFTYMTI